MSSRKILIIGIVVVAGTFVVLLFVFPNIRSKVDNVGIDQGGGNLPESPSFKLPSSAFLPSGGLSFGGTTSPETGGETSVFLPPVPAKSLPEIDVKIPTIEEVQSAVGSFLGANNPPSSSELISLPAVPDSSLNIVASGPSDPVAYVENFATGAFEKIEFDGTRFEKVIFGEDKLPLLPQQLVEKGIQEKNFQNLKESLSVFHDYIIAKEKFVKQIEVSGSAVSTAKELIGFDSLILELIDKAIAVADGQESITSIEEFYKKFETTSDFRRDNFLKNLNIFSYKESRFFKKVAGLFGINSAFAQLPFGTFIGPPIFCICSISYLIPTGPPVPAPTGFLNANLAWIASPGLFPYKSLRPGAAWLGNYSAPLPCWQPTPFCTPTIPGNVPVISGTSI